MNARSTTPPVPEPHALSLRQHLGIAQLRAVSAVTAVLAGVRRLPLRGSIETRRYGTLRQETLEILHPTLPDGPGDGSGPPPVVYLHGGGWVAGRKEHYSRELSFLLARGHRVYNLDYPLAPEHPFPAALLSLVHALAWIHARSADAERVHLMGDSAGGNLAMMLGWLLADPARLAALDPGLTELELPEVASVVCLYGVLDRLSYVGVGPGIAALFLYCYGGRAALEPEVGPELALTPMDVERLAPFPPCWLGVGTADHLLGSSELAAERLEKAGVPVELHLYEGERHGFFNLYWRERSRALRRDVENFLEGR